jgi:hypothetical protein
MKLSLHDHFTDAGIEKWFQALGVVNAPTPRRNIQTALAFFDLHMPSLAPDRAADYLRAMDLSRAVTRVTLTPADRVIAFRLGNESPFKLFYARSGASPYRSGINPAGRSIVRFRPRGAAAALESFTTGVIDVWTIPADDQRTVSIAVRANTSGVMVLGGGAQLIIPRSYALLEVIA